jgi:pilus assembly protein Flp/PilA
MMTVAARLISRPPLSSLRTERGATAVEYGLLLTGVAALIVLAVYAFGGSVFGLFTDSCDAVTDQAGGAC